MDADKFAEYLTSRFQDQITWYNDSASRNKLLYQIFQWSVIILSATVPVLVASMPKKYQWFTIAVSIVLAIGTAALKTFRFQENWINYRTVSETLKKEKHFYDAGLDNYTNTDDREALFVERVESMISRENSMWVTMHQQKDEEERKG